MVLPTAERSQLGLNIISSFSLRLIHFHIKVLHMGVDDIYRGMYSRVINLQKSNAICLMIGDM